MRWLQAVSPSSIFVRTTGILLVAFLTFAVLILGTVAHFTILPLARSAGDDLAALMLLSARSWAEIPPPARREFNDRLLRNHGLRITDLRETLPPADKLPAPYLAFVQESLSRRVGFDVPLRPQQRDGERWYWADLSIGGQNLRIGLAHDRIVTRRLEGVLTVAVITVLLVLITSIFMAGGTTRRIRRLSAAVADVSQGQLPEPLPEKGPREVRMLARNFNTMAHEVRELLANRTTLLAGVSHDLRTPLTRMRLSLEMLREIHDPKLIDGICDDLEAMDRIIRQTLALSRDLETREEQTVDLVALLEQIIADACRSEGDISWSSAPASCSRHLNPVALQRVLANLVENAVRYGEGQPVEVALECAPTVVIRVLDRGPGIPGDQLEAVFRPFHRLEASRSAQTGGSGLGLAITRQLAKANGWDVSLHPREGGGTEARVVLPNTRR
ncbi:Periplasmic Sensor Signal Transduction Histidine Kinase [Thioalkalivibrio nitratireducens DSM 14787]|uniref:histidine kinase n=1 Tax=Thioalkalivibrio nitratireducens (strain DSM 14787 / UNIQEM 213 / ALEN2) TaxID=1255043 RepID=L0DSA8_THIND|nr:ATP-binding protein [Thioalkalivibrio nitratireducens]AGA32494.1 Periplasmic Sensor Signal Transduction Histidine Kinase [Thioalkalivibrio nitratireducens DSM 14787]